MSIEVIQLCFTLRSQVYEEWRGGRSNVSCTAWLQTLYICGALKWLSRESLGNCFSTKVKPFNIY